MSYIFRTFECDSGGDAEEPHRFELMMKTDETPSFCPICGASVAGAEAIPGTKNVGKSDVNKAVDLTYRALEENSADRAEITGNKNFKITDMKDNLRQGDVAAMPIHNTVTQFMGDAKEQGISYGWGGGAKSAPGAPSFDATPTPVRADPNLQGHTGPGHVALSAVQGEAGRNHLGNRAAMAAAGQLNKTGAA